MTSTRTFSAAFQGMIAMLFGGEQNTQMPIKFRASLQDFTLPRRLPRGQVSTASRQAIRIADEHAAGKRETRRLVDAQIRRNLALNRGRRQHEKLPVNVKKVRRALHRGFLHAQASAAA